MLLCRAWTEYFTVSCTPYDDNCTEMNATTNVAEKKSLSTFLWLPYFCFTDVILAFYMHAITGPRPVLVYLIAISASRAENRAQWHSG